MKPLFYHRFVLLTFFSEVGIVTAIIFLVWTRYTSTISFVSLGLLLAVVISILLLTPAGHSRFSWPTFQILVIAILTRLLYFVATNFSVFPMGDPYGHFGCVRLLLDSHFINPPNMTGWFATTLQVVEWPSLHIISATLIMILNVDPFLIVLLMPWSVFVAWFLSTFLLLRTLIHSLNLGEVAGRVAMMVSVATPFAYMPLIYKYQDLAIAYLTIIFYLFCKSIIDRSRGIHILLVILIGVLSFTHPLTPMEAAVYMTIVTLTIYIRARSDSHRERKLNLSRLAIICLVASLTWVIYEATIFWSWIPSGDILAWLERKRALIEPLLTKGVLVESGIHPDVLRPLWVRIVINVRNLALFASGLLGLLLLLRYRRGHAPIFNFILGSLLAFSLLSILHNLLWVAPLREISIFTPLLSLSVGIPFSLSSSRRPKSTLITITFVALVSFTSLIAPFGQNYAPIHLYDSSIDFLSAGEHPLNWRNLQSFFEFMDYNATASITTDEIYIASLLVPVRHWDKLQVLGFKHQFYTNTVVLLLRKANVRNSYFSQGQSMLYDDSFNYTYFYTKELPYHANLLLNNGDFSVWLSQNQRH